MSYYILTDENHIVIYISHIPKHGGMLNSYHEYPHYTGNRVPSVGDYFIPSADHYIVRKEK